MTIDALLPIFALAAGMAVGVIQIFLYSREKTFGIQRAANERRLAECEKARDEEWHRYEQCRDSLSRARIRINELESRYERGKNAGPKPD